MGVLKRNVAAVVGGTLVLVGGSYIGAKALTTPPTVTLDAASSAALEGAADPAAPEGAAPAAEAEAGPGDAKGPRGPIRGEAVIARNGKFPTVRFNRGTLERVDGSTIVIKEADGKVVSVATDDKTRVRRDGEQATLADLKEGDHVGTFEVKDGDTYTTKFVRAFSSEKWEARQSDKQERRLQRRAERSGGAGGRGQ